MKTKFNTGDRVLIPGQIVSARQIDGGVFYEVEADAWQVPEESIRKDGVMVETGLAVTLKEIFKR